MGVGKDVWTEIARRYNTNHDLTGMTSLYAIDDVYTDPFGRFEGREAILAYLEEGDKPFSDHRTETSRIVEEGDTVVVEWTWRATHTGPFTMPDGTEIPATGKTVELPAVSVITVRDGMVASERDYFDGADFMRQLGLMPGS
jgi:steroid delta-isomerase-like uncharacterized protein